MTQLDEQPDRNITDAKHPEALVTQDPTANEPILIWEDVRRAAAQQPGLELDE
jgi:hypothetical protein